MPYLCKFSLLLFKIRMIFYIRLDFCIFGYSFQFGRISNCGCLRFWNMTVGKKEMREKTAELIVEKKRNRTERIQIKWATEMQQWQYIVNPPICTSIRRDVWVWTVGNRNRTKMEHCSYLSIDLMTVLAYAVEIKLSQT